MSRSSRILVVGGLLLLVGSMAYGLFYAVFVEHQTLDRVGGSLNAAFVDAAERKLPDSSAAMRAYADANYVYIRQVDAHGHWIGLGFLLFVLGLAFDRVGFSESARRWLAMALCTGAVLFPAAVLAETADRGPLPKMLAVLGSAIVIATLAGIAWGFSRETADVREGVGHR
jgi:hypothetical protein